MDKVIKDGKVAVLVSRGFGAGWSTWNTELGNEIIFDPEIVELVLAEKSEEELEQFIEKKYPEAYTGGVDGLTVEWVPQGRRFEIDEYDGAEGLRIFNEDDGITA